MTDQWRIYTEATRCLEEGRAPLRLCLQAAAGTGKSFLLETLFLRAILNGHSVKAAAPTGIAAARLRMPRTPLPATTLHYLFGLSIDGESKIDLENPADEGFKRIAEMTLLIVDEASMIDDCTWHQVRDQLSSLGAKNSFAQHYWETPGPGFLWACSHHCSNGLEAAAARDF